MIEGREPILSPTTKKVGEKEPFIIRGHHAAGIKPLITGEKSLEKMTEDTVTLAKRTFPLGYTKDVLGATSAEEETFKKNADKVFKTFNELPADHPIKIVAGEKDGICNSCAIGEHCGGTLQRTGDAGFIKVFEAKAKKQRLNDVVVTDNNGTPSITMSKGSLDAIVSKFNSTDQLKAEFYGLSNAIKNSLKKPQA